MDPLTAIALGLEARLKTIEGLRTVPHQPDQINPPQAIVTAGQVADYDEALGRGKMLLRPTIWVLVSSALNRVAAQAIYGYLSPTGDRSVFQAVNGDRTLGGAAEDVRFVSEQARELGLEEVGQVGYYGCRFGLEVMVRF